PAAEVQGVAAPGVATGTALQRMEELARQVLPRGIAFEWTELAYQQQQRGTPTILVFGAAALFVFLVLVAQYESWKLPLAIVLIVPMCLERDASLRSKFRHSAPVRRHNNGPYQKARVCGRQVMGANAAATTAAEPALRSTRLSSMNMSVLLCLT